jgi:hypothetical protein
MKPSHAKHPCLPLKNLANLMENYLKILIISEASLVLYNIYAFLGLILYMPLIKFLNICQASRTTHLKATKRILRYLKGSITHGIHYLRGLSNDIRKEKRRASLQAFNDVDWARDPNAQISQTGFYIYIDGNPIS